MYVKNSWTNCYKKVSVVSINVDSKYNYNRLIYLKRIDYKFTYIFLHFIGSVFVTKKSKFKFNSNHI